MCRGLTRMNKKMEKTNKEKDASDDKKVEWKNNINEHKECNNYSKVR